MLHHSNHGLNFTVYVFVSCFLIEFELILPQRKYRTYFDAKSRVDERKKKKINIRKLDQVKTLIFEVCDHDQNFYWKLRHAIGMIPHDTTKGILQEVKKLTLALFKK